MSIKLMSFFHEKGAKTVIPRKVVGKFSIRLVPNQTPEKVNEQVNAYLNDVWKTRGSPNKFRVKFLDSILSFIFMSTLS